MLQPQSPPHTLNTLFIHFRLYVFRVAHLFLIGVFLSVPGCGNDTATTTSGKDVNSSAKDKSIELGVIFANAGTYTCLPKSLVGLSPSTDFIDIKSSCECVEASIVPIKIFGSSDRTEQCLLLKFIPEDGEEPARGPTQLNVELMLRDRQGSVEKIFVRFSLVSDKLPIAENEGT